MLSQLIERFVKRLCGRWLRGFDGSQVNVSLGGTVTLEDLDLKTEELRALLLPYEPVSASVRRLRLEIDPLSSCLLYTSPSPRDRTRSRMPSSA